MPIMEDIQQVFKFKNDEVSEPSNYFSTKLEKHKINGHSCWTITSVDYVNTAATNISEAVKDGPWALPVKVNTPMLMVCLPELDGTPALNEKDTRYFQVVIGILLWATQIGRVDILHEVSLLSQYQACPKQGHMELLTYIGAYMKKKLKRTIYLDLQFL